MVSKVCKESGCSVEQVLERESKVTERVVFGVVADGTHAERLTVAGTVDGKANGCCVAFGGDLLAYTIRKRGRKGCKHYAFLNETAALKVISRITLAIVVVQVHSQIRHSAFMIGM